jgi:hypothetical protein
LCLRQLLRFVAADLYVCEARSEGEAQTAAIEAYMLVRVPNIHYRGIYWEWLRGSYVTGAAV